MGEEEGGLRGEEGEEGGNCHQDVTYERRISKQASK